MPMNRRRACAITLAVCLLVVAGVVVCLGGLGSVRAATRPERPNTITLAVNTFPGSHEEGQPIDLAVAIANSGDDAIYISRRPPTLQVKDKDGLPVVRAASKQPEVPATYATIDGRNVRVERVETVSAGGGIVEVVRDALAGFPLKKGGTYTVTASVWCATYDPKYAVDTPDRPGETWVRMDLGLIVGFHLDASPIQLTIE